MHNLIHELIIDSGLWLGFMAGAWTYGWFLPWIGRMLKHKPTDENK